MRSRYTFGMTSLPPDKEGWSLPAISVYAPDGITELLRIPYDQAAEALLQAFAPEKLEQERPKP
jgi:hypothetical protein